MKPWVGLGMSGSLSRATLCDKGICAPSAIPWAWNFTSTSLCGSFQIKEASLVPCRKMFKQESLPSSPLTAQKLWYPGEAHPPNNVFVGKCALLEALEHRETSGSIQMHAKNTSNKVSSECAFSLAQNLYFGAWYDEVYFSPCRWAHPRY